ncbi:MAG TPA: PaaI family thioesterase [bacterium]
MTAVPPGYEPLFRTSPFLDVLGPFYSKGSGRDLVIGFRVAEKHCNARGTVHGGMYATLADIALGYVTAYSQDPPVKLTTTGLTLDYAGSAKVGDWVEARVDIQKLGRSLAFVSAYLCVGDERVVRANATFLVHPPKGDSE